MRSNSTDSQPNSDGDPFLHGPPQAQLASLLDLAEEHAEDVLRKEGALFSSLFAVSPQGLFLVGSKPLNGELEEKEFETDARLICTAKGVTAAVMAVQAWVIEADTEGRPLSRSPRSESPQRGERVIFSGEADGGFCQLRMLPILRDGDGRFLGLLHPVASLPERPERPFGRLLPEVPPTPEVQAFALALLEARGVRLVDSSIWL